MPTIIRQSPEAPAADPENLPGDGASLGPLPGYIGFNLRQAQVASFRHLERTAAAAGLTPGQFSLLTFLDENAGVSQKTVSQRFGVDTSTLSTALDALARRGLVRRARSAADRRAYALSLTAAGRSALADMRKKIEAQEALMLSALSERERDQLLDMLARLCAVLTDGAEQV